MGKQQSIAVGPVPQSQSLAQPTSAQQHPSPPQPPECTWTLRSRHIRVGWEGAAHTQTPPAAAPWRQSSCPQQPQKERPPGQKKLFRDPVCRRHPPVIRALFKTLISDKGIGQLLPSARSAPEPLRICRAKLVTGRLPLEGAASAHPHSPRRDRQVLTDPGRAGTGRPDPRGQLGFRGCSAPRQLGCLLRALVWFKTPPGRAPKRARTSGACLRHPALESRRPEAPRHRDEGQRGRPAGRAPYPDPAPPVYRRLWTSCPAPAPAAPRPCCEHPLAPHAPAPRVSRTRAALTGGRDGALQPGASGFKVSGRAGGTLGSPSRRPSRDSRVARPGFRPQLLAGARLRGLWPGRRGAGQALGPNGRCPSAPGWSRLQKTWISSVQFAR
nr:translation initiation factor IF-2 [Oryctolagus cuniculus]